MPSSLNSTAKNPSYAGIGSRQTPNEVLESMRSVASQLARIGFTLRSGGANGADSAFEQGAMDALNALKSDGAAIVGRPLVRIFLPWKGFNAHASGTVPDLTAAYKIAQETHPAWSFLSHGARKLHARNCYQVLGDDLQSPADFVLCWTKDGCTGSANRKSDTGGTATAIILAEKFNVPVINMKNANWVSELQACLPGVSLLDHHQESGAQTI
jgi:hypothetical protein